MPRLTFPRLVPVLLALSLGLAACGSSDDGELAEATVTQPPVPTQTAPEVTIPTTTVAPAPTPTTAAPPTTTPAAPEDNGGATDPATPPQTTPQDSGGASTPTTPAATPTTPADSGGASTPDESGGAPTPSGCGDVANGFISGVEVSGAACGDATTVANDWLGAVGESGPTADVVAGGYACSGVRRGDQTVVTCIADGGRRVTFAANN